MTFDQDRSPPMLEALTIGTVSVSDGILTVPLRVYAHGTAAPEGDVLLVLPAELGQELLSKLQARVPQALRQAQGKA